MNRWKTFTQAISEH